VKRAGVELAAAQGRALPSIASDNHARAGESRRHADELAEPDA
jgi:hypothetical protein